MMTTYVNPLIDKDCKCRKLCFQNINKQLRQQLYNQYMNILSYSEKNKFLCDLLSFTECKPPRIPPKNLRKKQTVRTIYSVPGSGALLQVCRQAFGNIFGIKWNKVQVLLAKSRSEEFDDLRGRKKGTLFPDGYKLNQSTKRISCKENNTKRCNTISVNSAESSPIKIEVSEDKIDLVQSDHQNPGPKMQLRSGDKYRRKLDNAVGTAEVLSEKNDFDRIPSRSRNRHEKTNDPESESAGYDIRPEVLGLHINGMTIDTMYADNKKQNIINDHNLCNEIDEKEVALRTKQTSADLQEQEVTESGQQKKTNKRKNTDQSDSFEKTVETWTPDKDHAVAEKPQLKKQKHTNADKSGFLRERVEKNEYSDEVQIENISKEAMLYKHRATDKFEFLRKNESKKKEKHKGRDADKSNSVGKGAEIRTQYSDEAEAEWSKQKKQHKDRDVDEFDSVGITQYSDKTQETAKKDKKKKKHKFRDSDESVRKGVDVMKQYSDEILESPKKAKKKKKHKHSDADEYDSVVKEGDVMKQYSDEILESPKNVKKKKKHKHSDADEYDSVVKGVDVMKQYSDEILESPKNVKKKKKHKQRDTDEYDSVVKEGDVMKQYSDEILESPKNVKKKKKHKQRDADEYDSVVKGVDVMKQYSDEILESPKNVKKKKKHKQRDTDEYDSVVKEGDVMKQYSDEILESPKNAKKKKKHKQRDAGEILESPKNAKKKKRHKHSDADEYDSVVKEGDVMKQYSDEILESPKNAKKKKKHKHSDADESLGKGVEVKTKYSDEILESPKNAKKKKKHKQRDAGEILESPKNAKKKKKHKHSDADESVGKGVEVKTKYSDEILESPKNAKKNKKRKHSDADESVGKGVEYSDEIQEFSKTPRKRKNINITICFSEE